MSYYTAVTGNVNRDEAKTFKVNVLSTTERMMSPLAKAYRPNGATHTFSAVDGKKGGIVGTLTRGAYEIGEGAILLCVATRAMTGVNQTDFKFVVTRAEAAYHRLSIALGDHSGMLEGRFDVINYEEALARLGGVPKIVATLYDADVTYPLIECTVREPEIRMRAQTKNRTVNVDGEEKTIRIVRRRRKLSL